MINSKKVQLVDIKRDTGNPGPLGLCGFGLPTMLLNIYNAELIKTDSCILSRAFWMGGILQIFAGVYCWKKNAVFPFTVFSGYASFWLSFTVLNTLQQTKITTASTPEEVCMFLGVWLIFTMLLMIAAVLQAWVLLFTFITVALLIILLIAETSAKDEDTKRAAGAVGILAGALATYLGLAEVVNEIYGRQLFWIGERHPAQPKKQEFPPQELVQTTQIPQINIETLMTQQDQAALNPQIRTQSNNDPQKA